MTLFPTDPDPHAERTIRQRLWRFDVRRIPGMAIGFRAECADRVPRRSCGGAECRALLSRERAILRDQQREVVHEVADAISELDRAYTVLQTSYNRLGANRDQLGAVQAAYEADKAPLDLFLDAQRRVADAETDYYLNRARYTLASKNVHFVKGTLLDYDGVQLAEGPWPGEAYVDAAKREAFARHPLPLNYASSRAEGEPWRIRSTSGRVVSGDSTAAPPVPEGQAPGTLPSEGALPISSPTMPSNSPNMPLNAPSNGAVPPSQGNGPNNPF